MKHYMILDTETTNSIEQPLPYDIGYVICDEDGNIVLERSYCVAEMFIDNKDLLDTAYYADKIPQYKKDLATGKRKLASLINIRKQIWKDLRTYGVKEIGGYNMSFDKRACNNDLRYLTKSYRRFFFPKYAKLFCIWNYACNTVCDENFITWAKENEHVSACGNVLTNAEVVYRYLTDDNNFSESHTGLEDVKIETFIFMECKKINAKADKTLNPACWQKVQTKRKQLEKMLDI